MIKTNSKRIKIEHTIYSTRSGETILELTFNNYAYHITINGVTIEALLSRTEALHLYSETIHLFDFYERRNQK